jgi:hypothetical protein
VIWKDPKVKVVVDSPLAREALLEALRGGLLTKWERGVPLTRGVTGRIDRDRIYVWPKAYAAAYNVAFDGAACGADGGSRLRGMVREAKG